jgi:hypothetical protein
MLCRQTMTPRIQNEMRVFSRKLVGNAPLPFWAESAMRQHAEYAAADWCQARGLQGLDDVAGCASLPSSQAALDLVEGKPAAIVPVLGSMLGRAALIGAGLFVVGERRNLVKYSAAAAVAIELFVIGYVAANRRKA